MTKKTNTTKKATSKTTVDAVKTAVDTTTIDFEFLRRNQTRVLKADEIEELKTELEKVVTIEQNTKYNYGLAVIIDNKKFAEIWAKADVLRVTISKRNIGALKDFRIDIAERTAIKVDRDTHEEYTVETEFIFTKEEVFEILDLIKNFAKQKAEEKAKAESKKKESKKAKAE